MKKFKMLTTSVFAVVLSVLLSACGSLSVTLEIPKSGSAEANITDVNEVKVKNLPVQLGVDESTSEKFITDYSEIARNKNSILYADEKNGAFALQDIKTEKIWYSTPNNSELDNITSGTERMEARSQLLVRFVLKEEESTVSSYKVENSQSGCVGSGGIKTKLLKNGIRVEYTFKKSGFTVPVTYTLTNDAFEAKILADEIKEGDKAYLIGINLLPTFGAGDWNTEGYLFVPDGSGAVIDFNGHGSMESAYDKDVYGKELTVGQTPPKLSSQNVKMPVFGTVTGGSCLAGIITEGDTSASVAVLYGTDSFGYNAVSSVFNYRTIDCKQMFAKQSGISNTLYRVSRIHASSKEYRVEYRLLNGEKASYVGIAEEYRGYLLDKGVLKGTATEPALNLKVYGIAKVSKSFLGLNYSSAKALTSFKQANTVIDDLKEKGISDICMRYVGFSGSGIVNDKINTDVKPNGKLGGSEEFYALSDKVRLYPDFNLFSVERGGNGLSTAKDITRTVFDYRLEHNTYSRSVYTVKTNEKPLYYLNAKAVFGASEKLMAKYKSKQCTNISLTDFGDKLYSDFGSENGMYRDETAVYFKKALAGFSKLCGSIALESANAYTFEYADKIWEAPMFSSGYDIYKTDVPFYGIVLHGCIATTSEPIMQSQEPSIAVLKAVESGNELNFACTYEDTTSLIGTRFEELYSTRYEDWSDYAAEIFKKYHPLLKKIYSSKIISHSEIADGVFVTGYENGVYVAVNYNNSAVTLPDGTNLGKRDFCELEGGKIQ